MQYADRLDALAGRLDRPFLVSKLANIRYLTGFTGSSAHLVISPDGGSVFLTDGRYGETAEGLLAALPATSLEVSTAGMWDGLSAVLGGSGPLSVEAHDVSWEFVESLQEKTGRTPVATSGVVEDLRRTKDPDEVASLQAAADAGDAAFGSLPSLIESAGSEMELGWALVDEMRRRGGSAAGWDPIVAAGPGSSVPHYRSGSRPIGGGLLLLDYGCVVDGYHSDMSRTVWRGGNPDSLLAGVYEAVAAAQRAGIEAVAPGVRCGDVDEAVRAVLRERGYEDHFIHSTGHGVGLEIHEAPWLRRGNDDLLRTGDAITVEPGVYLPGVGGVRIEDMVLVTSDGPVVLTKSSREFELS